MVSVRVLFLGGLIVGLAGCASASSAPAFNAPLSENPDLGFGCPGGHLADNGGTIQLDAAPFKAKFGYAANTGGLCAHGAASTTNVYGAPGPPSGWSALLYAEIKMADRYHGDWQTSGPREDLQISAKHDFDPSRYYCAAWYVSTGSTWTKEWTSQTVKPNGTTKLILSGASPDYTPYFNAAFVLKTETVFELLEPPADNQC
jgi:hypothetical protein